jgi:hypothetical protein
MTIPVPALLGILVAITAAGLLAGILIGTATRGRRVTVETDGYQISVTVVGIDEAAARLDQLKAKANEVVDAMLRIEDVSARLPEAR